MQMVAETVDCQMRCRKGIRNIANVLLIGANQRIIRCNVLVVSEQITPSMHRSPLDTRTLSSAVLVEF